MSFIKLFEEFVQKKEVDCNKSKLSALLEDEDVDEGDEEKQPETEVDTEEADEDEDDDGGVSIHDTFHLLLIGLDFI